MHSQMNKVLSLSLNIFLLFENSLLMCVHHFIGDICLLHIQAFEIVTFFGYYPSIGCIICENIFPFCRILICLHDGLLCHGEHFQFFELRLLNC